MTAILFLCKPLAFIGLVFAAAPLFAAEKLTPEALVELHLQALGPEQARQAIESRTFKGHGIWRVIAGGSGQIPGPILAVSDKERMSVRFASQGATNHYGEHFLFDGEDAEVLRAFQGGFSNLGEFILTNAVLLREGLLGGVVFANWALLDVDGRQPKLKYAGLKKQDGVELHRLDYKPNKGGGKLNIELYFDPETYRHVRTRYEFEIPAPQSTRPEESADFQPSLIAVTEMFSNFREVDGVFLPANWLIRYDRTNQGSQGRGSYLSEMEIGFQSVSHNAPIDDGMYKLGAKIDSYFAQ